MKLSLPRLSGRSKQGGKPAAEAPASRPVGGEQRASLRWLQIQLLVAAVVLLAGLALFIFQLMSGYLVAGLDKETDVTTEQVAARVASMVEYYG